MPDADSLQPTGQQPDPTPLAVLPDVNVAGDDRGPKTLPNGTYVPALPGPGFIPGELHLDPSIAPQVPPGAPRPFAPGEYIVNPNGDISSEISVTPQMPDGTWVNIPSLWLKDGRPYVAADEDEALQLALQSKLPFKTYPTMEAANQAAQDRETGWGKYHDNPSAARAEPALWDQTPPQPRIPQAKDALNLSNILPLLPNQSTILEQAIDSLTHSLGFARNPRVGYLEGDTIPSPENKAYNQTLDIENAGTGQDRPRELPLLQGLGMANQLRQLNPPRDESLTDYMFTNPQYPVTTGAPYKMVLPTMPTQTPGDPLPPDPIAPPQAQPHFGATPIGDVIPFGPGQTGVAPPGANPLINILKQLGIPYGLQVNPRPFNTTPYKAGQPANEALLKGVKPLPQDTSEET